MSNDMTPLDFLNPARKRAKLEVQKERYNICKLCDKFNSTLKTCTECNCIMRFKVSLDQAVCPIGKW